MDTLKVAVTQECIDLGEGANCSKCPIALGAKKALRDRYPDFSISASATHSCIEVYAEELNPRFKLVERFRNKVEDAHMLNEFMAKFDEEGLVGKAL